MSDMENKEQEPIRMLNLVIRFKNIFFRMWPVIVVLAVLCGAALAYRSGRSFVPMYESKAIFTVDAGIDADDIFSNSAYRDQFAAQEMASTFPYILSTDMMQDLVRQQLNQTYIRANASAQAVADSNMLILTATSADPQLACDYLEAIIECYPQVARYMADYPKVRVMNPPNVPTEPYNSFSVAGSAVKGGVVGAALGVGIIFILALMTRTVQTTDELKAAINLPIIVALPKVNRKKRRSGMDTLLAAETDPNMEESIRGLRVKVKKLLDSPEKKTVLFTSTLAGEGKTTVAVNLARSLAKEGRKVVILDADLRSQSVARALGEKSFGTSLMECLKDPKVSILDCVRENKDTGLAFVSGKNTDKRHYTIDSKTMKRVIKELTDAYDYVVVDTPPCEIVSDATALCRYADCVLYVVKQDYAQKGQLINCVTALDQKGVKITGCIFNGVPQFHRHYGYGYRSSYGYGYDYGYRKYGYGSKYGYGYASKYKKGKNKHKA